MLLNFVDFKSLLRSKLVHAMYIYPYILQFRAMWVAYKRRLAYSVTVSF